MNLNISEIESLEQQFIELVGEFSSLSGSNSRVSECLRAASSRAECAEAALNAAERNAVEAHNNQAASTACAQQAATFLATANEQITGFKIQLELSERQRNLLVERHSEMSTQMYSMERELQQLRPLQQLYNASQRQYTELQERVCNAIENARREVSQLESELRRVERCAADGREIRERARLAAAAHARERRLAAVELQQTTQDLNTAKVEITRLGAKVTELELRLSNSNNFIKTNVTKEPYDEFVKQLKEALDTERAGAEKLEQALKSAVSDNAALAAIVHTNDNEYKPLKPSSTPPSSFISPIDSFLAD